MRIDRLELDSFRNYGQQAVEFDPRCNVIFGENAQGKTNIIEALWLFCGGHSFRTHSYRELIAFDKSFSHLECAFFGQDRRQTASITRNC